MVILLILKIQAEVRIEKAEKPSHGIVDIANKENARFIVTGSRGMGVIRRTILGSVSDFILHHANCPVFVYKMQWNAQLTPTIHEKLYYIKKYYSRDVVKKWLRWYIHVILCSMVSIGTLSVFLNICDAFKKTQECLQLGLALLYIRIEIICFIIVDHNTQLILLFPFYFIFHIYIFVLRNCALGMHFTC